MSLAVLEAATEAYAAGLCVLPVRADGSKMPAVTTWRPYRTARPTPEEMRRFRFETRAGLGLVAGEVSGRVECWDFDDDTTYTVFCELALASSYGRLVDRIRNGYEDTTPRGGRRWIVRYGDTVTAQDCTLARRQGPSGIQTLIELPTWAIVAPSGGPTHPSGRPYRRVSGSFASIAAYEADERAALFDLGRSFDRLRPRRTEPPRPVGRPSQPARGRPGDVYNARMSWEALLEPLGWSAILTYNGATYWRRPGKAYGTSATTGYGGRDLFHVFSSSTPLLPDRSYSKFAVYTWYYHAGDYEAAALALAEAGFEEFHGS